MDDRAAMSPLIPAADAQPAERRFDDLSWLFILAALTAAPLLGTATLTWGVSFLEGIFGEDGSRMQWSDLTILLLSPSVWALISGLAYLHIVSRTRGFIARYECLLLGGGSAFLAPFVFVTCVELCRFRLPNVTWSEIQFIAMIGLLALPFGLFGGWVLWCFGVRPATPATRNFAAVFD